MRRAHHDAFEDGLAADKSFLTAFKGGQQLNGYQETYEISQRTHRYSMLPARKSAMR